MATVDRKSALCNQTALTGIDFIQVVDPTVQTVLRVYFGVEPTVLDTPLIDPLSLTAPVDPQTEGPAVAEPNLTVTIGSTESENSVEIGSLAWRIVVTPAGNRVVLEVTVVEPGDFSIHRLTIEDTRIDPFFNGIEFSFKQGCPSLFDCEIDCDPEPPESVDFPVDYLARDFHSFRRALLDFAAERYPQWSEPLEADQAVMLMEIMAVLGDEFAYTQDRYALEATLGTATQRRSRSALARLVDYHPDPGVAAETELAVWVAAGTNGDTAEVGSVVWAEPDGLDPIPFSVLESVWHHENWNDPPLHCPDSDEACLPAGSNSAYLVTESPTVAELPPGETLSPEAFWVGRRAILRSRPADPGEPERAFAITITAVEHLVDELVLTNGAPTPLTRIDWDEPTPWPLLLDATVALLNIVPVVAGEQCTEHFRTGSDADLSLRFDTLSASELGHALALPRAVEREGPYDQIRGGRERIFRYGLRDSIQLGLGWRGQRDPLGLGAPQARRPLLELHEVLPDLLAGLPLSFAEDPTAQQWDYYHDLLETDLDTPAYTLEEGMWRTVVTHQTPFEDIEFQDYAGNEGWTIRFGHGAFGRPPEPATIFAVRYFTAPGTAANLSHDSITQLTPPDGSMPGLLLSFAESITNPLPITSGADEETAESIRINAPEAFRALPLRAVRPEDYRSIIERMDWVQRANATSRWTGSWMTDFVAVDPLNGFALTEAERTILVQAVDCIRQATRDARVLDPDYLDIDLEVTICVRDNAYPGEVAPRVEKALTAPGFFNPDNFTFGQPLRRSALEAAVHSVPGVKGVDEINLRVRRKRDWEPFAQPELAVAPHQIIRLQNDPTLPGRGSLIVEAHGGAL